MIANWKHETEAPPERDVWDAWFDDGLHLMVIRMRQGQCYAAMANLPCLNGPPIPYGSCTDFVFETRDQAMREAESLGDQARGEKRGDVFRLTDRGGL